MVTRRPPESESTERNAPSVEAAFQAAPAEMVAEILDGELYLSPRPARPHANVASRLGMVIGTPFMLGRGGPGGWVILDEPELHLGPRPDKLVPDLAGWRRERLPDAVGGDAAPAHYDLVPDWACEVLSDRTRSRDKGQKMRIYAREGVRHLWHVDPVARTLDIFRLAEGQWLSVQSFSGEARVRAEPFDAIELELALVWSR
ncbi:Uma2 family endonuclease [Archangium lansingense]|uniref:Uma2 family endonuclease n=1 Tax=Archangium lansingense TaxID=2995310 RepID=A0ABT4A9V5_9BACT|nr:Uma2 family endonuclease [Archangium lansinium]MCY1078434.1 Uma2 family endonuclease [Archangium lansinium]